jgi:transcriptional regulator with XRE-family HTH domain
MRPGDLGAIVRSARLAAGLTQAQLGKRIGASRFWVADFEAGKPRAEIGRALKALHALGLELKIRVVGEQGTDETRVPEPARVIPQVVDLSEVLRKAAAPVIPDETR